MAKPGASKTARTSAAGLVWGTGVTGERSPRVVIAYLAFLGMLMAAAIDTALPAFDEIDADLGAGGNESLIVLVFFLGAAFGQLVIGPVSDAIGRRPVLLAGLVLYILASAASALAPSYGVLLVARFVWGLGAAAPAGMRTAISRDLYSGDTMARVVTIMMAVFMIGPIVTPLAGEGLLRLGSWRLVFWFTVILGFAALASSMWFGETLPEERRRRFQSAELAAAGRAIVGTRVTIGHIIANVFWSAAFFIFLSSSQVVVDRVFGRADQFAFLFALIGLMTIPLLLLNNRRITAVGARRASLATGAVSFAVSVLGALWVVFVDATPTFWLWYVWLFIAAGFVTLSSPPMYALALEPMGDMAGTVSSLLYFSGFAMGAGLATIAATQIEDRVGPFVVAFAIYATIAYAWQLWARPEPNLAPTE